MVGIPVEGIGLILGVDRFLDMCRTTLNVTGDLAAAVVGSRGERGPAVAAVRPSLAGGGRARLGWRVAVVRPPFDEWVLHCFDPPVSDPQWHFAVDAPGWTAPSAL